ARPQSRHPAPADRTRFGTRPGRPRAAGAGRPAPFHRSSRRGRPGALRAGDASPQRAARGLLARGFLAGREIPPPPHVRDQGVAPVSKEIVDAVKALEQEKGISADKLMDALEDALLSAYKKTPGAAKYARVDLDHETGDFRVFELILPPELEEK